MPEGHTLHRLATALTDAFAGHAGPGEQPAGTLRHRGRAARRRDPAGGRVRRASTCSSTSTPTGWCTSTSGLIGGFDVHRGVAEVPRAGRPGPAPAAWPRPHGVRRPARRHAVRAGHRRAARRDRRAARPRPAARRRRPRPGLAPDLAQPARDRRPADGPGGPGRRRQRLPRRGAVPAPHPPAAARPHAAGRASGGRCGTTWSC